ncbi:hypothetical protein [Reichenbachiella agariperforans]|uniref:hypothetical protein n=1 Tax=Reichenbachiella agariperforans TaxID=156994 RepID=UPI001C082CB6|nr:hypothetical protein [Reichenbachiella agariperforans]MBU2912383.1 hypothetical protein [Reichenbachiella agariperforans]
MKKTRLMSCVLFAAFFIAFALAGCEEDEIYRIDAPSDLQARIDSVAAAKAGIDTGDTTYIDIATAIVGAEDYSSAWWTAFSDYFTIPSNKLLHLEFINHNGGSVNNWNNWNVAVVNNVADREGEGYAEYFVLRSDAFGWGNTDFDLGLVAQDYPVIAGSDPEEVDWDLFRTTMDGAYVSLEIDHSVTGNVYVTATVEGTNGIEMVMTYNQPVSAADDINAFLVMDASYVEMETAYLLPSNVSVVVDYNPVSIAVTGAPATVEIGNENFWGSAVATVTYEDGSSTEVDSTDISFNVVPDMTTLGEKTVVVAYSKTKLGEFTQAVSTYYNLEVTNSVVSMDVTTMPDITSYYFYNTDPIVFNTKGLVVTATYSDATTGVISNENLQFGTITAAAGAQTAEVSYVGSSSTVTTTVPLTLTQGIDQVGLTDMTTPWWSDFSDDYTVASGSSTTIKMYCYSNGLNSYHSPSTILRKADGTENGVVRMDNFGWGTGYEGIATATSDWNWDVFAANISGSYIEITVTNNGDDTADIRYDVTYANGDTHFQEYTGIAVDSADLNAALVLEGAYLVIVE